MKQWNEAIRSGNLDRKEAIKLKKRMSNGLRKYADTTTFATIETKKMGSATFVGMNGLKGLGVMAKTAGKELLLMGASFLKSMAVMAVINLTIQALTTLWELVPTKNHLKQWAEEANEALENTQSELESAASELKEIKEKIVELQNKGALSLTEQDELRQLKLQNIELERKIKLLEKQEEIEIRRATQANLEVVKAYTNTEPVFNLTDEETATREQLKLNADYGDITEQVSNYAKLIKLTKEELFSAEGSEIDTLNADLAMFEGKLLELLNIIDNNPIDIKYTDDPLADKLNSAYNIGLHALSQLSDIELLASEASISVDELNDKLLLLARSGDELSNADNLLVQLGLTEEDLDSAGISLDDLKNHIIALRNASEDIDPSLADKFNLSGAITELTELETKFNTLTKAYEEFRDNDVVSLDSLDKISSQFGTIKDTDAFIEAMAVLSNSKSTLAEVEAAMNSLINAYASSKDLLNNITDDNKELYVSQLEQLGVINAVEVAEYNLNKTKLANINSTEEEIKIAWESITAKHNLTEATYENIAANVTATERLGFLQAKEADIAGSNFDDVVKSHGKAILSVAAAAGVSVGALSEYIKVIQEISFIEERMQAAIKNGGYVSSAVGSMLSDAQARKESIFAKAQSEYEQIMGIFTITTPEINYNPTSSSSYKPASGSGSGSDSKTNFDWIEVAISRIQRAITSLEKQVGNTFKSWSTRNSALTKQLAKVREEITLQEAAYNAYMREANAIGLSSDWVKKIQSGAYNIDILKDKTLIEKIQNYKDWYEKALACQDAIEDLRIEESNLYKQKFDSIITKYDGYLGMIEHERTMLEDSITQTETKGYLVSAKYYEALIKAESENISNLQSKKNELISALNDALSANTIELYSEEWYNMNSQINDVTLAIQQGTTSLIEYGNAIRDLEWEVFDLLQDNISSITDEANFLVDLLSREKLHDDKGQLTDAGMSTMGLHGVNYNVLMAQADEYAKEVLDIDKALANDPNNQTLLERRKELLGLQQDSILAAEQERDAIKDLVSEGIQLELDALQELIDSYNEALDNRKELYEYEKKIAEQVKEVAKLEKQMVAYQGDSSEEAQSKIQQIKVSLEEARDALAESEYDKYISDQKALLDNLYLEYETVLNQRLDNIDLLMEDMVEKINQNADVISATILEATENVGYTLSESMNTIWNGEGTGISSVIVTYADKIAGSITSMETTVNAALNKIADKIQAMLGESDEQAAVDIPKNTTTNNSSSGSGSASGGGSHSSSSGNSSPTPSKNTADGTARIGDKVKFASGVYYADSYGGGYSGYYNRGKEVFITAINKSGSHPYHISTGSKLGVGDLGWLKLSQLAGYFRGKKNIGSSQFAWTQERGGEEYIIRPSDGAILTPLARGDSVLNAVASENLWSIANNPSDFIRDKMGSEYVSLVDKVGSSASYVQNLDKIIFNMPNVKNYDEILTELQRDKNFERLLNAMTIDMLVGGSSLAKNKAIRR